MKGRMYFDLFGHRHYNTMQPFFMVDPVLKQSLRGSCSPRSYIQCIQDSNRPLSSLLTPVGWTRPNISLARNEMARQISGLAIPVSINPFKQSGIPHFRVVRLYFLLIETKQ